MFLRSSRDLLSGSLSVRRRPWYLSGAPAGPPLTGEGIYDTALLSMLQCGVG
ncbi:Uncharacterised protein [Mycobacterium tuberculosis]|nr:Uncharacterised protein [Mycobacterium tuberculosis]